MNREKRHSLVVVSDTHLGMRNASAHLLAEFIDSVQCDTLVLNGDIIDGTRIVRHHVRDLPEDQLRVMDALNRKMAQEKTQVIYIPGNHDAALRGMGLSGKAAHGVVFADHLDFTAPDGRRLLIAHGDRFDPGLKKVDKAAGWLKKIGDFAYINGLAASGAIDAAALSLIGRRFHAASRGRRAAERAFGGKKDFMRAALEAARAGGYDGVVCGHSHAPRLHAAPDGVTYANSGDWVENFTALAMDEKGAWTLIDWPRERRRPGIAKKFNSAAFRPATLRAVKAAKRIWPG